ncbi:hypothetical protein BC826DRAFT_1166605, partial [Russula brevipes]
IKSRGKGSCWGLEGIEVKLVKDHIVSDLAQVRVIIRVGLDKPKVPVAVATLPPSVGLSGGGRQFSTILQCISSLGGMGGMMDSGPSVTVDVVLGIAFASVGGGGLAGCFEVGNLRHAGSGSLAEPAASVLVATRTLGGIEELGMCAHSGPCQHLRTCAHEEEDLGLARMML